MSGVDGVTLLLVIPLKLERLSVALRTPRAMRIHPPEPPLRKGGTGNGPHSSSMVPPLRRGGSFFFFGYWFALPANLSVVAPSSCPSGFPG